MRRCWCITRPTRRSIIAAIITTHIPRNDAMVPGQVCVTWVDGELCHGTWEVDDTDIRSVDSQTGKCWTA